MKKSRKAQRIHLIYYLLVFERETGRLLGNIVDISSRGMKLLCRESLSTEWEYPVRMVLPEKLSAGSKEILFKARCVWCEENIFADFYGAGFQFTEISSQDVNTIRAVTELFGYKKDKTLV